MPLAEIESVVHVSSEDSLNPAKNLITSAIGNNVKKWLCQKKGDKNVYVVFKLKEKANITHITIGNENTAIIEILVGNANTLEKEYQVLLPTTELQTVQDVRAGKNKNAVHFFTSKDFNRDVAQHQWERLKVVCSQPYDSHIRYGLSCFVIKSIKDEDDSKDEMLNVDEKKAKALPVSEDEKHKISEWKENVLQRLTPASSSNSSFKRKENENNSSPVKKKKLDPHLTGSSSSSNNKNEIENGNTRNNNKEHVERKENKKPPQPSPKKNDFKKILEGVRFSMSGYENPLRSDLRNKGLEMGAKYSGDWDSRCTHLVCAFLNTPKFNQVRSQGNGKIVSKDWIEVCYKNRRRLPWRRFALDPKQRSLPESEEDEEEELGRSQSNRKKEVDRRRRLPSSSSSSSSSSSGSDSDTEDEIERIQAAKKAIKTEVKEKKKVNKNIDIEELYNAETDDSEEADKMNVSGQKPDTSDLPLPPLPDFPSHNYYIAKDETGEYRHQLERYIHAFKGNVYEELCDDVEFAITDDLKVAKQITSEYPRIKAVRSDWVWKCNDEDSFISPDQFLL